MSWLDDLKEKVGEIVQDGVMSCKADAADVNRDAAGQSLSEWRAKHIALAIAAAGGNLIGGPVAFAALAIEIPALLNIMSRGAMGIGTITIGSCSDEDYPAILAVWAGAVDLNDDLMSGVRSQLAGSAGALAGSQTGATLATTIVGPAGAKLAAKATASLNAQMLSAGMAAIIGKKLMIKGGTKLIAAKIAAKVIASVPTRLVPILGAAVAGGINAWFLNSLMDAAERYYVVAAEFAPAT